MEKQFSQFPFNDSHSYVLHNSTIIYLFFLASRPKIVRSNMQILLERQRRATELIEREHSMQMGRLDANGNIRNAITAK